jgi:DNA-binding NarL/FixJ family response regulator
VTIAPSFPVLMAASDTSGPETAKEPAPRDIVLVVDDSPETLGFLSEALEGAGLTVLVAVNGESALELTQRITPDLILLDAVMPGIGGFETCRRLKQRPEVAHIPVIFMTGLSETEHIVRGLEAGGVDYLTKPVMIEELTARMRVHLVNARRGQTAEAELDAAGRFLLALSDRGDVLWSTPHAAKLLARCVPAADGKIITLPAAVVAWLLQSRPSQREHTVFNIPLEETKAGASKLELTYLGCIRPGEHLLRLSLVEPRGEVDRLRRELALTAREAEVLLWLARGKSNKDISDILAISPRTVNKHLEQVYEKLGVENRSSATAIVLDQLHRR